MKIDRAIRIPPVQELGVVIYGAIFMVSILPFIVEPRRPANQSNLIKAVAGTPGGSSTGKVYSAMLLPKILQRFAVSTRRFGDWLGSRRLLDYSREVRGRPASDQRQIPRNVQRFFEPSLMFSVTFARERRFPPDMMNRRTTSTGGSP
ncbi:MAG: hypothetical protein WD065_13605 [Planctomycetaceae bacterium]